MFYPEDLENPQMEEYFVPVNLMPAKNMELQGQIALNEAARINQTPVDELEAPKEENV